MEQRALQISPTIEKTKESEAEEREIVNGEEDLVSKLQLQVQTLQTKLNREAQYRQDILNKLHETRGNVRVICRIRPDPQTTNPNQTTTSQVSAIHPDSILVGSKIFRFDRTFSPSETQTEIFVEVEPLILSVLEGYNCCIFAYGQTGSGKTYTMEGTPENRGVNYRSLERLFREAQIRKDSSAFVFRLSVLEIYNEKILDLLVEDSGLGLKLRILEGGKTSVEGLSFSEVSDVGEAWRIIEKAKNRRSVGKTCMNASSSRSHCIVSLIVSGKHFAQNVNSEARLYMVDLAGSERITKSQATGSALKETVHINKSLSVLGDVIQSLLKKAKHVPYRNSKLTHLLKDALGGDSKTLMVVQISPCASSVQETLCSLNFAMRVKSIELGPVRRHLEPQDPHKACKETIFLLKREVEQKTLELDNAIQNSVQQMNKLRSENAFLRETVFQLESKLQLFSEGSEVSPVVSENSPLDDAKDFQNDSGAFDNFRSETESSEDDPRDGDKENIKVNPNIENGSEEDNFVVVYSKDPNLKGILRVRTDNGSESLKRPKKKVRFTLSDETQALTSIVRKRRLSNSTTNTPNRTRIKTLGTVGSPYTPRTSRPFLRRSSLGRGINNNNNNLKRWVRK